MANALLSAGGRNTLKYGLTNDGQVYTKSKLDLIDVVNQTHDNNLWNIAVATGYGRSDHKNTIIKELDELPTNELLYQLPQLLLLGMIDRKPENIVIKYKKTGPIKCYEIDHDDVDLTDIDKYELVEKKQSIQLRWFLA